MSMTDIVSAVRWPLFTEAAFVLALAGFAIVLATVFLRSNVAAFERARFLPLEEDRTGRTTTNGGSAARVEMSHE